MSFLKTTVELSKKGFSQRRSYGSGHIRKIPNKESYLGILHFSFQGTSYKYIKSGKSYREVEIYLDKFKALSLERKVYLVTLRKTASTESLKGVYRSPEVILRLAGEGALVLDLLGKEANILKSLSSTINRLNQIVFGYENSPNPQGYGLEKEITIEELQSLFPSSNFYIERDALHFWQDAIKFRDRPRVLLLDTFNTKSLRGFFSSFRLDKSNILGPKDFVMTNTSTSRWGAKSKGRDQALRVAKILFNNHQKELFYLTYKPRLANAVAHPRRLTFFCHEDFNRET